MNSILAQSGFVPGKLDLVLFAIGAVVLLIRAMLRHAVRTAWPPFVASLVFGPPKAFES
jgi:hypothetical protein